MRMAIVQNRSCPSGARVVTYCNKLTPLYTSTWIGVTSGSVLPLSCKNPPGWSTIRDAARSKRELTARNRNQVGREGPNGTTIGEPFFVRHCMSRDSSGERWRKLVQDAQRGQHRSVHRNIRESCLPQFFGQRRRRFELDMIACRCPCQP